MYRPTQTLDHPGSIRLPSNAVLICSEGLDDRAQVGTSIAARSGIMLYTLLIEKDSTASVYLSGSYHTRFEYSKQLEVRDFILSIPNHAQIYLDITDLAYDVWLPLYKVLSNVALDYRIVYVEPSQYTKSNADPFSFDLTAEFKSPENLIGFSRLFYRDSKVLLVAFLGFEATRFATVKQQVDVSDDRIYPVIGLPGFHMSHPITALKINSQIICSSPTAAGNIVYADAACPFSVADTLSKLYDQVQPTHMKLALIGTKPHGLGAAIFRTIRPHISSDLLYDFPIKKKSRTTGIGKIHIYDVKSYVQFHHND